MRIARRIAVSALVVAIVLHSALAQMASEPIAELPRETALTKQSKTKEILTDAAIALLLVAASIAAYKAMGKPCACPEDTMRNGRKCGGSSAWARAGGYKPLCYPTEITKTMIEAYRTSNAMPKLR